MDADWAAVWIALGALVISLVAALFTGLSALIQRGQLDAARRQADIAQAALDFEKRMRAEELRRRPPTSPAAPGPDASDAAGVPAPPVVAPWSLSHVRGDRYHLTNGSPAPTYDVVLEAAQTVPHHWNRVDPGDPTTFRAPPREPGVVVRWRWSPGGSLQEWTGRLPGARG